MTSSKASYLTINFFPVLKEKSDLEKKYFHWFCMFWLLIATLELGQDVVSSILNNNQFHFIESLSYKLFWLLFIPFSMLIGYALEKGGSAFSDYQYFLINAFIVLAVALIHLVTFSFVLLGISNLIHVDPWQLSYLMAEKLSTRLYIALSIHIVFSILFFLINKKGFGQNKRHKYSETITVKNGKSSVIVNVDDIKWISSDGNYLYLHTSEKKHVILDSLKNIITTLPENFKRIHRSTIVNIEKVKKLKSRGNGDYDIILDNNQILRLSRNYTKPLKGLLL